MVSGKDNLLASNVQMDYMYFATPLKMLNFTKIGKNQITSNFFFFNFLIIEHLQKY